MHKRRVAEISVVLFFLLLVQSVIVTAVSATQMREIELTDGTVIAGEIISLSNGIYTVRSDSLGTVQIMESKVRTIRTKGSPGRTENAGGQIKSLQENMMGNEDIMKIIQSLLNDSDFQEILQDPAIMKAVQDGDIQALMSNPAFMKLLDKMEIRQIKNKISP